MHVFEKVIRVGAVLAHQPTHGGSMFAEKRFLQPVSIVPLEPQMFANVIGDIAVDLVEQITGCWVESIVEVEQPSLGAPKDLIQGVVIGTKSFIHSRITELPSGIGKPDLFEVHIHRLKWPRDFDSGGYVPDSLRCH